MMSHTQIESYKAVKVKLKIAYEAARKQISILELFIGSILEQLSRKHENESFF